MTLGLSKVKIMASFLQLSLLLTVKDDDFLPFIEGYSKLGVMK